MISFEEALRLVLEETPLLPAANLSLERLSGYALAEPVVTPTDLPAFDNSAVDGYGVKLADVSTASPIKPAQLRLLTTIQAGDPGDAQLQPGTAVKILTGAPVPPSVEAVVMREYCRENGGTVAVEATASQGDNIRRRAGEFHCGQQILSAGVMATPPVIGLLATLGYPSFPVYERPRVAIMVTGNELVRPGKALSRGQIYNSNSYALAAAVGSLNCKKVAAFHARDERTSTKKTLLAAIKSADVVISTGGVSVGDFDYVKEAAEELGVRTVFWRIALKPGKPVYFGTVDGARGRKKLIFGLPGNPVSVLVTFHELVKPSLLKMAGCTASPVMLRAVLSKPLRKRSGRMEFVRANVRQSEEGLQVVPLVGQDSHMLGALSAANCLIHLPADVSDLDAGSAVHVELLDWSR